MKLDEVGQSNVNRVVINESGEATTLIRAAMDHGITPAIIFIKDDGWTLGAPKQFAAAAFELWPDCWTHYAQHPDWEIKEIREYIQ
jgi:hypothetical protein